MPRNIPRFEWTAVAAAGAVLFVLALVFGGWGAAGAMSVGFGAGVVVVGLTKLIVWWIFRKEDHSS